MTDDSTMEEFGGSKVLIFHVATKSGEPFAVLVIRGDEHTSTMRAMPLLPSHWRSIPGSDKAAKIENAVEFAMQILQLDRQSLRASGYAEPQVQEQSIRDDVSYEVLLHYWRSSTGILM